jgi:hypothetical protein
MNKEIAARVECFSGHTYAQRPVAFVWQEKRLEVSEIEAEWHTSEGKRFWVRTSAGQGFELFYFMTEDEWVIEVR